MIGPAVQRVRKRLSDVPTWQLVILLIALTTVGGATYSAVTSSGNVYTTGATFQTDSGLAVQFEFNQTLEGNPFDSQYRFNGSGGTVTASGNGDAFMELNSWGANSSTTIAQNLSLTNTSATVDPINSSQLRLNGTASEIRWDNVSIDDGSSDFQTTVTTGEYAGVTVFGATPGEDYRVVNSSGSVLAVATADDDGEAFFNISESATLTVQQYDNELPSITSLSPSETVVNDPITLSATIDDDSLPGETVDVVFRVEGSTVHTTSVTSAGEVNYTLTAGELPTAGATDWSVSATDNLGAESISSATFYVPGNMTVRNVSNPDEVLPDATATIYTEDGFITRDADANGNISLTDLPANELLVFEITAPNYTARTMAIESVVQAGDAYLIPNNTSTVVNRFTLEDATGSFGSDSIVYIKRPLTVNNTTAYRTVAADEFGVEGFDATLVEDQRYRITIVSADGDVAQMGSYVATQSQEVPLRPESPTVQLSEGEILAYSANVSSGSLNIQYEDPDNETEVLTVYVVNRFNSSDYLLKPTTYYGTNSLSLSEPVGANGLNESYMVVIEGQRDGESFTVRIPVGPEQSNIVPGGLSTVWVQIGGITLTLLVGGTFSKLNVGVGAVTTSLFCGILWYIGLLNTVATWATVAIAILFAVLYAMVVRQ